jgi:hypothetical protein
MKIKKFRGLKRRIRKLIIDFKYWYGTKIHIENEYNKLSSNGTMEMSQYYNLDSLSRFLHMSETY